jgi:hypothetical protein
MARASGPTFASAKRDALRAVAQQTPDSYVPDSLSFSNENSGFKFRMSNMSSHIEKIISWEQVDAANYDVVGVEVSFALEDLARAQGPLSDDN